ncbi:MAG: hypothetical protein ABJL67_13800 [Sulfitobacter sp.]
MMNITFALGAGVFGLIFALHLFAGGQSIAKPLLDQTNLNPVVRLTHYYCWHIVTISLAQLALLFGWAAIAPNAYPLALIGTATALAFSIWGLALVVATRQKFRHMPQGFLFLPVALLGLAGLLL